MGCIKDMINCGKCKEESNIKSINMSEKLVTYQCTGCGHQFVREFKKVKGYSNFNLYFILKTDGKLQYKCGLCGKSCNYKLEKDNDINESLLIKCAYEGICKNCVEEKEIYCECCGKKIDIMDEGVFIDQDDSKVYCTRECFLKKVEKDYF